MSRAMILTKSFIYVPFLLYIAGMLVWSFRWTYQAPRRESHDIVDGISWEFANGESCAEAYKSAIGGTYTAYIQYNWPSPSRYGLTRQEAIYWAEKTCRQTKQREGK